MRFCPEKSLAYVDTSVAKSPDRDGVSEADKNDIRSVALFEIDTVKCM